MQRRRMLNASTSFGIYVYVCMCTSKYRYGFVIYINPHVCIFFSLYKQIHVIDEVHLLRGINVRMTTIKKKRTKWPKQVKESTTEIHDDEGKKIAAKLP